jgi:hypothetical protein
MSKETKLTILYFTLGFVGLLFYGWIFRNMPFVLYFLWIISIVILFIVFKLKLFSKFRAPYIINYAKVTLGFSMLTSAMALWGDFAWFLDKKGNEYSGLLIWVLNWASIILLLAINYTVFRVYKAIEQNRPFNISGH